MRTKHQVALAASFVGLFCLATACSDDDGGSPPGNEAGESGAGASSGGGGNGGGGKPSTGNGGTTSGNGGEPMGDAGEPPGNGGQAPGDGGKPSTNGGESSGGNSLGGNLAGSGGEPSGQGGGAGDSGAGCTPLTIAPFGQAQIDPQYAVYATSFTPNVGAGAADNFRLAVQGLPYDGERTGTFDLTQNGDDNYKTCARCVLVYADGNQKVFYASEGTLQIAPGSKQLGGSIDATLTNLKLVEVTIAGDYTSTPVTDGACLTVASAAIQVEAPACGGFECKNGFCVKDAGYECDEELDCPDESDEFPLNASCDPVWLCEQSWYGDGDCDCGCGIKDSDCTGTTDENECEFCVACQGNANGCSDSEVDPANTTQCL